MVGKVRCIDPLHSTRARYQLEQNKIYTIKRITGRGFSSRDPRIRDLFFELVEIPSAEYLIRRFEVIGKINITLPDDIYNIPII